MLAYWELVELLRKPEFESMVADPRSTWVQIYAGRFTDTVRRDDFERAKAAGLIKRAEHDAHWGERWVAADRGMANVE